MVNFMRFHAVINLAAVLMCLRKSSRPEVTALSNARRIHRVEYTSETGGCRSLQMNTRNGASSRACQRVTVQHLPNAHPVMHLTGHRSLVVTLAHNIDCEHKGRRAT